jgi:hypothetical protein
MTATGREGREEERRGEGGRARRREEKRKQEYYPVLRLAYGPGGYYY